MNLHPNRSITRARLVFAILAALTVVAGPAAATTLPGPESFILREGTKPALSGNGLWVAYQCNNRATLCLSNTDTGVTQELLTVPAGDILQDVDISGDGMVIAYWVRPGASGSEQLFVYDRDTDSEELVSVNSDEEPGVLGSGSVGSLYSEPRLSRDGRYVIFSSAARNLVEDDTNGIQEDIFVRDRQFGTTTRVSLSYLGEEVDGRSGFWGDPPIISADGRTAVFESDGETLVPGDIADDEDPYNFDWNDVFLVDIPSGDIVRMSEVPGSNIGGDEPSELASLSPDGRFGAFLTTSENLYNGRYSGDDLLLYTRSDGSLRHVNPPAFGDPQFDTFIDNCKPEFNFNGSILYFCARASNLVAGDTENTDDVFAWSDGALDMIRPVIGGNEFSVRYPSSNDLGDVIAFAVAGFDGAQGIGTYIGIMDRGDLTEPIVLGFGLIPGGTVVQSVVIELEGAASDVNRGGSAIAGAEYKLDDEMWVALDASDGAFDSEFEQFSGFFDTGPLTLGNHTVCARATDVAGHVSAETCMDFEVAAGSLSDEFMLSCSHSPLWPQPGETVRIDMSVAEFPEIDGPTPFVPVERTEIWFEDSSAPVEVNDYFGTSSNVYTSEALAQGSFSYGCRAKLGDTAIFSGWRTVAVGSPGANKPIPVVYTGPSAERVDIVFVADGDTYESASDPVFLNHIEDSIRWGFYGLPLYNRHQHQFNFWLSRKTGMVDPDPDSVGCLITKPSDWEENYAFANAGAVIHQDKLRDCARNAMFSFEPEDFRVLRHEAGHRPFGLLDEYCCDGGYRESEMFPNVYESSEACMLDAPDLGREAGECRSWVSTRNDETYYSSEPTGDDLMNNNTIPRAADIRRIEWAFEKAAAGLF